jgi:hypothetical protein
LGVFVAGSLPIVVWLSVNDGSPVVLWHNIVNNLRYTDRNPVDDPGAPRRIDAISMVARYVHAHLGGIAEVVCFVLVLTLAGALVSMASTKPGWPLSPDVLMVLGTATLLAIAHQDYDLLLMTWSYAVVLRLLARTVLARRTRASAVADDPDDGTVPGPHGAGSLVMPVLALPALVASLIPARDTLHLLCLGTDVGLVSTLTTASLILALAGAATGIVFHHPQEVAVEGAFVEVR